jgi:hypothetical protein
MSQGDALEQNGRKLLIIFRLQSRRYFLITPIVNRGGWSSRAGRGDLKPSGRPVTAAVFFSHPTVTLFIFITDT